MYKGSLWECIQQILESCGIISFQAWAPVIFCNSGICWMKKRNTLFSLSESAGVHDLHFLNSFQVSPKDVVGDKKYWDGIIAAAVSVDILIFWQDTPILKLHLHLHLSYTSDDFITVGDSHACILWVKKVTMLRFLKSWKRSSQYKENYQYLRTMGVTHKKRHTGLFVVHRFVCEETVEEKISSLQVKKKELAQNVLSGTGSTFTKLSLADLRIIFGVWDGAEQEETIQQTKLQLQYQHSCSFHTCSLSPLCVAWLFSFNVIMPQSVQDY